MLLYRIHIKLLLIKQLIIIIVQLEGSMCFKILMLYINMFLITSLQNSLQ